MFVFQQLWVGYECCCQVFGLQSTPSQGCPRVFSPEDQYTHKFHWLGFESLPRVVVKLGCLHGGGYEIWVSLRVFCLLTYQISLVHLLLLISVEPVSDFYYFIITWHAYCSLSSLLNHDAFSIIFLNVKCNLSSVFSSCSFQFALHHIGLQIFPWSLYSLKCPASQQNPCLLAGTGFSTK